MVPGARQSSASTSCFDSPASTAVVQLPDTASETGSVGDNAADALPTGSGP